MTRPQAQEPWDWPPTVERFREVCKTFRTEAALACYFGVPRHLIHSYEIANGLVVPANTKMRWPLTTDQLIAELIKHGSDESVGRQHGVAGQTVTRLRGSLGVISATALNSLVRQGRAA